MFIDIHNMKHKTQFSFCNISLASIVTIIGLMSIRPPRIIEAGVTHIKTVYRVIDATLQDE